MMQYDAPRRWRCSRREDPAVADSSCNGREPLTSSPCRREAPQARKVNWDAGLMDRAEPKVESVMGKRQRCAPYTSGALAALVSVVLLHASCADDGFYCGRP